MSTRKQIEEKINAQRNLFKQTMESMVGVRGIHTDIFNSVLPIFEHQLDIMEALMMLSQEEMLEKNRQAFMDEMDNPITKS